MVDHLTLLQIDPTAAIAPNVDLVSWSRLGDAHDPSDLRFALVTRRLASLGIARAKPAAQFSEPVEVGEAGDVAEVEGVPCVWRVDPDALAASQEPFDA